MALNWTTTGQHALEHGIKVCVYGRAGAGKTRLIPTAPRPIIASAESGTLSIAGANVPMTDIGSMAALQEFYDFIIGSAAAKNYDTVCLDSITEIAERSLTEEKKKSKDPRQAYGEMMDKIAVMIRLFRDLPGKNVYFSAKAAMILQPDGSQLYGPSMPGQKTGAGLPYYFDEFFYLGVAKTPEGVQYNYLLTRPDQQYEAKDRSGALDMIEKPDLTHVFNKIRAAHSQPKA